MYSEYYLLILVILITFFLILFKKNYKNYESFSNKKQSYFKNKVILVTGSTSGIGLSLSKALSKLDCKLIIQGKSEDSVQTALNQIGKNNDNILGVAVDLSDEKNFDLLYEKSIEKFNKIDILVNNIINRSGSKKLTSKSYKDWKSEMNVNINSIFYITQKVVEHMKDKGIKGKIINISSNQSKQRDTKSDSGSLILSKTFIERMNDLMASETENDNISIGVIRIDSGNFKKSKTVDFKNKMLNNTLNNINQLTDMLYDNPDELVDIFLKIIQLPHHQLNGKVYSTSAFKDNPNLSKIVPSYQLLINQNLYKDYKFTKTKKKGEVYLTKQNPYGISDKINEFIKNYDFKNSMFNVNTKLNSELGKTIAKNLNISSKNITFFRTEMDALRKIFITFITKYSNVFSLYPNNEQIELLTNELKLSLKFTIYKINNTSIQPKYKHILNNIDSKTKLIYFTSPNFLTGQSLQKDEFEKFLNKVPDNIIIVINQTMRDFIKPNKKSDTCFDPIKYLDKNIIVVRSFSNFYGYENLELTYLIASKDIIKLLNESNVVQNQIDTFNEKLSLECLKDTENNKNIRNKINKEKKRIYKILDDNDLDYFPSEVNYILLKPKKNKEDIQTLLKKEKIILEDNDLHYNDFWSLPLSTPEINNKIMDVLVANF